MPVSRRLVFVTMAAVLGGGLVTVPAGEAAAATVSATLVATRTTSTWGRPSPDPAGITYDPGAGRLIISDCEVEETPLYAGTNLFLSTLDGVQSASDPGGTTLPWSREPTGVGYRAADGRLFVSDDDTDRIYEVRAGADGRHGTPDDVVTSFSVRSLGSGDPEDVAIDMELTSDNHLLVIDGGTKKIYDYGPGGNGVFDGQPADGGDDTVSVIDVGRHGALDPEGVAFDARRNTILALDGPSKRVYELNRQGQLLNIVDIRAAQPKKAAGITIAPASNGSGALNWYIVDRGVDNDNNPQENDGRFYEMAVTLPPLGAPVNATPRVNAGPDKRVPTGTPASLTGSADDDGLPNPPAAVTVTWSTVSGPGTATFADPSAAATTATFSAPGTYVLRLTASDGELSASDDVTVVVDPPGSGVQDVPVATGTDDAEERSASVSLTGTDLELVVDGTTVQTVGMRFAGLLVPPGATITAASVQFSVDEASTAPTSLVIAGQAADNAPTFTTVSKNVSSRPRTTAQVAWTPAAWTTVGARGADQQTPDLAPVLQQIVSRPGWASGNAVVLVVTGTGTRTASASERGPAKTPVLHVEWTV
jgi:hypothetical protein